MWRLIWSSLLLISTAAPALELQWDWQSGVADYRHRTTALFAQEPHESQWQSSLAIEVNLNRWRGNIDLQHNRSLQNGDTDTGATLSSLYWQDSFAQAPNWELTLGKLQLDWGVGYGYRPLNIFNNYQRNPVGIQIEQGADVAMLTHFTDNGSWQWLVTRSHYSSLDSAATQIGGGLRHYWLDDANEWQTLLYWDAERQWLLGGSLVTVVGESLEFHASLLYQHRYQTVKLPDASFNTVAADLVTHRNSGQLLAGLTWANPSGIQVIAEYWFDSRSWRQSKWQQAFNQAAVIRVQQPALANSYALGYNHQNVLRHSILLHTAFSNRCWQQLSPQLRHVSGSIDLLLGPVDGSVVFTPRLAYQLLSTNSSSLQLSLSWRYYGGKTSSAFANLGDNSMTWLGFTGRF